MSKFPVHNVPRLKLSDLLRRRKMTLVQLCDEFGITTYEGLIIRCNRMGCAPPTEEVFKETFSAKRRPVNNPQEGIIVLEPLNVVDEISGKRIDPDVTSNPQSGDVTEPTQKRQQPI